MTCVQCHKDDGQGLDGLAPPLADSEWALGPESRMIRIVLGGLQGPINVDGKKHSLEMPSLQALSDEDIASALTYVRRSWSNTADPVTPDAVKAIRTETAARKVPWTERELLRVK
jgi:mono/diheme cytochrome c family protein